MNSSKILKMKMTQFFFHANFMFFRSVKYTFFCWKWKAQLNYPYCEPTFQQSYLKSQHQRSLTSLTHLCFHGADVVKVTIANNETLLHVVAKYNLSMAVDTLLQYGGELKTKDGAGNTPLLTAAR